MKNKRGFTLIEIMAVIIILAIIALIVVPLITSSIKGSKDKLYDTQLENIKSAAKSYMINLDLDDNQNKISITIDELKKLGLVDKDIKNPKTGEDFNKCLTVEVTKNGNIYDYTVLEDIEECDETGNVIMTLIGSINETAYLNRKYVDAGVILKTDKGQYLNIDDIAVVVMQYGDETKKFVGKYSDLTNLIDTSNYYKYEITYKYVGPEGSASKVRNVEVKDTNNLQCLILPVEEKNQNGWVVDSRRAEIKSINTNKKVTYSISESSNKNYDINNRFLDITNDGKTQVYGYIRDEEGNEAACTSILKFEVNEPSCQVNLSGEKSSTGWYTSNVTASLVPNIISDIVSQGISLNNTVDYNGESSLIVNSSGNIYGYIKDEAGKEARCSSNVKIDTISSISVSISGTLQGTNTSYIPESTATSNVVLTGTVNPGSTPSGYKYQWYKDNSAISGATGISYTATTSGNYKLIVTSGSGVTGNSNTINVKMQVARPTCSLSISSGTSGKNGWYTSNVTVGMTTKDAKNYGLTTNNSVSYNGLTSQTLTSTSTIYCYVSNETGTNSNSLYIKIDTTKPTGLSFTATAGTVNVYNTQSLTLTAVASDPESGINRYEFYDGSTLLASNTTGVYTVSSLSSSATNYKVRVYNNAGLYSESSITESCSVNSSLSNNTCYNENSVKTTVYTCTGTGRQYSISSNCICTSRYEEKEVCGFKYFKPTETSISANNFYNMDLTNFIPILSPINADSDDLPESTTSSSVSCGSHCSPWGNGCKCYFPTTTTGRSSNTGTTPSCRPSCSAGTHQCSCNGCCPDEPVCHTESVLVTTCY